MFSCTRIVTRGEDPPPGRDHTSKKMVVNTHYLNRVSEITKKNLNMQGKNIDYVLASPPHTHIQSRYAVDVTIEYAIKYLP